MPNIIKFSKYCIIFSILITLLGIAAFIYHGVTSKEPVVMDIDFKGGNIIEVNIGKQFNNNDVAGIVKQVANTEATVQKIGTNQDRVTIKTAPLGQEKVTAIFEALKQKYGLDEKALLSSSTVQPMIGQEIWQKGLMAMFLASILILIYLAIRFRTMSGLSAGTTAVIALLHDAFIMFTVYSLFRIPVNSSFVAAVLTILGYSINDTIIVYDRIRENQRILKKTTTEELVNKSILQTLTRSIYTVVTVLISVVTLYVFGYIYGVQSIKEFTLPLIIGLISGAYSSIFIASPIWVWWQNAATKAEADKRKVQKKAKMV